MRTTTLAALAALLPCAAQADSAGTIPVDPAGVKATFTSAGTQTLTAHLDAGQDYAVANGEPASAVIGVRDAGGHQLATASTGGDTSGASFRAPYSGDYFLDVTEQYPVAAGDTDYVWLALTTDCAAGPGTLCALAVGATGGGRFDYDIDRDWWRVSLRGGRSYHAHLELGPGGGELVNLRLMDASAHAVTAWACGSAPADGNVQVCDLVVRVPRSGTYYLLAGWGGAPSPSGYTISLSLH